MFCDRDSQEYKGCSVGGQIYGLEGVEHTMLEAAHALWRKYCENCSMCFWGRFWYPTGKSRNQKGFELFSSQKVERVESLKQRVCYQEMELLSGVKLAIYKG